MQNSKFIPRSRKSNLVVQDLENEVLIYDLDKNKAFSLNQTSAVIWNLCNGKNSVFEIAKLASRKLDSKVTEDFVWLAIEQLKKDNLLEDSLNIPLHFEGLSRREVIRKVGLASLVALPVVASLVAPTSASAASLLQNGAACTDNNQCATSCCGQGQSPGRTCQDSGGEEAGTSCVSACECISGCCGNLTCLTSGLTTNSPCTFNCECSSGNCITLANTRVCA